MRRVLEVLPRVGLALHALAIGCAQPATPEIDTSFRVVTSVRETMLWILEPAADGIWDRAGFVITAEGETDLSPSTEEGWDEVRRQAALVAETGNLLMLPGRSLGPEWVRYAGAMIEAGRGVMAAAQRRDADALFDAGGDLYQTCRSCHDRYMLSASTALSVR